MLPYLFIRLVETRFQYWTGVQSMDQKKYMYCRYIDVQFLHMIFRFIAIP